MNSTRIILIAALILVGGTSFAFAGPSTSGGGVGVACQMGRETTLETLDLFEAKLTHLVLIKSTGLAEKDYSVGLSRIRTLLGHVGLGAENDLEVAQKTFAGIKNFTDQPIPQTSDLGQTYPLPRNCKYLQIAIFSDKTNSLLLNRGLWQRLDPLNKAALLLHESIYKFQRYAFKTTSEQTRYLVRQLLAAHGPAFKGPYDGLDLRKTFLCNAGDVEHGKGLIFLWQGHEITLIGLLGEIRLVKTTIETPVSIEDIGFKRVQIDASKFGLMVNSIPQSFEIKAQRFESTLPIQNLTWSQQLKAGKLMEIGINFDQVLTIYPVQSCVRFW